MTPRRTYWHLEGRERKPSDYDIATTGLLYYPERGFEVRVPLEEWYEANQRGSRVRAGDLDAFRDPRATTYARYTALQHGRESFVDELLRSVENTTYDRDLDPAWIETLALVLPTLRFPVHGLQMAAAYVGHMAPASRVVIACLFQAADELRRTQRLAQRMRQLQDSHPRFGQDSLDAWQRAPKWQPLRRTIEQLLVTWDWAEAFVALNLVIKPLFDDVFMERFAEQARTAGDDLLARLLHALAEDCDWQRSWSAALTRKLVGESATNRITVDAWIEDWIPRGREALAPFWGLAEEPGGPRERDVGAVPPTCRTLWHAAGVMQGESGA